MNTLPNYKMTFEEAIQVFNVLQFAKDNISIEELSKFLELLANFYRAGFQAGMNR